MLALLFSALCLPVGLCAQETPSFFAEDFLNQSLIVTSDGKQAKQCQAVRILPNWYLTAAHCVRPYCDKECRVTVTLLSGKLQASANVYHSSSENSVFVPRQYRPGTSSNIRYDMALIHFNPLPQDYTFYDAAGNKFLDKESFLQKLKSSSFTDEYKQWKALQNARPKLIQVSNAMTRLLEYPIAVPKLRPDGIFFQHSDTKPFYYFTELQYYMGKNFGVEKGMSGSGVIMQGGDVVGIVSASLSTGDSLIIYDNTDQEIGTVPYSEDYFMFTPFNRQNVSFINATVSSFHDRNGKRPHFVNIVGKYAKGVDDTLQTAFGGALTVQDVLDSTEKK